MDWFPCRRPYRLVFQLKHDNWKKLWLQWTKCSLIIMIIMKRIQILGGMDWPSYSLRLLYISIVKWNSDWIVMWNIIVCLHANCHMWIQLFLQYIFMWNDMYESVSLLGSNEKLFLYVYSYILNKVCKVHISYFILVNWIVSIHTFANSPRTFTTREKVVA